MTVPALSIFAKGQADLLDLIFEEVALVEEELALQVQSRVELVDAVGKHILRAGGKRLRPAFVTLTAKASGMDFSIERSRRLGACMELIHMATLLHDDVIDHSATRRGRPTANSTFGNTASVLSGDALVAKTMVLLAEDGDLDIIRCVAEAVVELAEGEVRELETRGDFDLDEQIHLDVLRRKTASLIEACCEIGGLVSGAPKETIQALKLYGHHIGMAFQIVDDLLDYRGDHAKTGKPIATDFREGQATLPLLYLREHLSPAELAIARRKFGGAVTEDEVRMIADWMATRGAFAKCEALAKSHTDQAIAAIAPLPDSPSKELLETVADYVLRRQA